MVIARFENDTTTVNVRSDSQTTPVRVGGGQSHNSLLDRDLPNQHPISSITDLVENLNSKVEIANQTSELPTKLWIGSEDSWRSNNIAESHPDWLCFVHGLGVMLGTVTIAECVTPINEWSDND